MKNYEKVAVYYAERFGIVDYKLKGNTMEYKEELPTEGTYKATVNLDTMKETRKQVNK